MSAPERVLFNDPTAGLELVTGNAISEEATRHLFLAADLLDPARSRDLNLKYGGEELPNRCLRRTNGLVPRCTITPMEMWGMALPAELVPDGVRLDYKVKSSVAGEEIAPSTEYNPRLVGKPLFFVPVYPGDMIADVLNIASGEHRGIVEIEALRGTDFGGPATEMQNLFFGDFPLPVALRLIAEHIEQVGEAHADPDVKSVAESMLLSCTHSREYLEGIVSVCNTQLDTRVKWEHTYRLYPKIRHFMAQLELKPRSSTISAVDEKLQQVAQSGISAVQLEQILTRVLGEVTKAAPVPAPAE